jgi:hypothetical protein
MAASILAVTISSCGSSEPEAALAPNNVLSASELSRDPQGSVDRAFDEYWSALQFRSWADAAAYYTPDFRDFVGTAAVIAAKKLEASSYPLLKPSVVRLKESPGEATVYYTLRLADGTKELQSITWRESDGNWQIVYDSRLDGELSQSAQNKVEIETTGVLASDPSEISQKARLAGDRASRLQARFLEQELKG